MSHDFTDFRHDGSSVIWRHRSTEEELREHGKEHLKTASIWWTGDCDHCGKGKALLTAGSIAHRQPKACSKTCPARIEVFTRRAELREILRNEADEPILDANGRESYTRKKCAQDLHVDERDFQEWLDAARAKDPKAVISTWVADPMYPQRELEYINAGSLDDLNKAHPGRKKNNRFKKLGAALEREREQYAVLRSEDGLECWSPAKTAACLAIHVATAWKWRKKKPPIFRETLRTRAVTIARGLPSTYFVAASVLSAKDDLDNLQPIPDFTDEGLHYLPRVAAALGPAVSDIREMLWEHDKNWNPVNKWGKWPATAPYARLCKRAYITTEMYAFARAEVARRKGLSADANGAATPAPKPIPPTEAGNSTIRRRCYERDHKWLEWYEDTAEATYHSPAKIRDRWNSLNKEQRQQICPRAFKQIQCKTPGEEIVNQGLRRARKERTEGK